MQKQLKRGAGRVDERSESTDGVGASLGAILRPLVQGCGNSETTRFGAGTGLKSGFSGVPTEAGVPRSGSATSAVVH